MCHVGLKEKRKDAEWKSKNSHFNNYEEAVRVPAYWKVGDVILDEYEVRGILGEGGIKQSQPPRGSIARSQPAWGESA